ncbi:ubiquitin carboxyl-terminal hydrolase MIY1 [[Candida] railenensis]|uniref:Ubiquitin carboxyl-terminal hydrolase MIY1 n=1 Tax=[Candida] railenensis TaxID=45579 RepID=A0A9P0QJD8_9ASCO|nr:ubiquitin carboxyl-terminal hydrolase MIY1 [[Candida] railenensis]
MSLPVPDTYFAIKTITWSEFSFQTPILLQDENGPCPLIALVNTLVLQYEFESQTSIDSTSDVRLNGIHSLRSILLEKGNKISLQELLEHIGFLLVTITNSEADASKLLDLLPQLHTGLSVNPNLVTGEFPPEDVSTILFQSVFGLQFKHGWVLDADIGLIQKLECFDQIQDELLNDEFGRQTSSGVWLEDNKTQMTAFGLEKLKQSLQPNEFTIFFRNNHFNTLFKNGSDEKLYLLLTDKSFNSKRKIIWQSLTTPSGKEDIFYTGDFFPILDEDLGDIEHVGDNPDDIDLQLIKQLQEEDDQRMAQEMQDRFNKPAPKKSESSTKKLEPTKKSGSSFSRRKSKKSTPPVEVEEPVSTEKKKKPTCVIV